VNDEVRGGVRKPPSAQAVQGGGPATPAKATRRRRGEPRRLLLEAARELFAQQGYNDTSTREIADRAGVSEPLLFRWFGSKVGLFREAVVGPFVEFVEDLNAKWQSGFPPELDDEAILRQFIADLFDLFQRNRALVVMLWAGDTQSGNELAESGVFDEILTEMRVLTNMRTADAIRRFGKWTARDDMATRSTLAMVAGMAVFGEAFYGKRRPSRKAILDELTKATLYGHLHRR
jgi:AcrR family transcriptional regulator